MYTSTRPQDAAVYFDTATWTSGTGSPTFVKTGLPYIDCLSLGIGHLSFQTTGTYSITDTFQVSDDGVTFSAAPVQLVSTVPQAENTSVVGGAQALYELPVRGWRYFRFNITAYVSGTWNVTVIGRAGSAVPATTPTVAILEAGTASIGTVQIGNTANTTPILANPNTDYPSGATPITAASGNVANASAAATLAGTSGKTTFITGFEITAGGATVGALVTVTVTGTVTGTLSYTFATPTGAAIGAMPLIVAFPTPIPASATNTAIVVTLPALGAGNTNATVVSHGYQL